MLGQLHGQAVTPPIYEKMDMFCKTYRMRLSHLNKMTGAHPMKIAIAAIVARNTKSGTASPEAMFAEYVQRIARYMPVEAHRFLTETALLAWLDQPVGRTAPHIVLLDSRGKQFSSEDIAAHIGRVRDSGVQQLIFAVGPADGWSPVARTRAGTLLSFGPITLPHELARVVLAEQVYRALTILAGHPYHSAH